jgi:hypothetical protein
MNWLLEWTREPDLTAWEQRPLTADVELGPKPGDKQDNHERIVGVEAPGQPDPTGIARRLGDAILRFDVFPPELLTGVLRRQPVEIGDTVGLRYPFVPGIHLFFAARVIACFDETANGLWRCGFTYRTIEGHPACGEEDFVVEKELATGQVKAALRSWSRPGILIAKLTYPIMRALQVRAAGAALDHLQRLAEPAEAPALVRGSTFLPRRNVRTRLLRSDASW